MMTFLIVLLVLLLVLVVAFFVFLRKKDKTYLNKKTSQIMGDDVKKMVMAEKEAFLARQKKFESHLHKK